MNIILFWREGYFIMSVDGRETVLYPSVGLYLDSNPNRSCQRKDLTRYEPNDIMNHLRKQEDGNR
jgi:hypothetical protein